MPTPEFVLDLRRRVGTAPLPLIGVTAVILRGDEVLLGRRADTGALTPVTGIVDPGEEPAFTARREAEEEAGVEIRVDALAWVHQVPRVTYPNGDQADYLDLTFRCTWLSGEPHSADGEMTDLAWHPIDALEGMAEEHRERVRAAVDADGATRFENA
ncbi:NUDIX domain-containing protein [Agromyces aurantiacus]|uniref:NUDIX domain-containing protein n=1 Tax=Agromyces aurantiacus TaxID=165814 RepID=A0ABV9R563_9MICO|nr:NUDIX domain-containing protein [Agromyces aurantiacus]MBM7503625.1 8-oxo-dGTP pyrophosphatase MutT (NUDIX family) [Agromyces aurantiacus]